MSKLLQELARYPDKVEKIEKDDIGWIIIRQTIRQKPLTLSNPPYLL
jgi:hypothetical protein